MAAERATGSAVLGMLETIGERAVEGASMVFSVDPRTVPELRAAMNAAAKKLQERGLFFATDDNDPMVGRRWIVVSLETVEAMQPCGQCPTCKAEAARKANLH